jgi:hypothetical protein
MDIIYARYHWVYTRLLMRPTDSNPTLFVTDIKQRPLPLNFVVTGRGMSITI